jgi:hypothetical protein
VSSQAGIEFDAIALHIRNVTPQKRQFMRQFDCSAGAAVAATVDPN